MKLKNSANVITMCGRCLNCVDCCRAGIQCEGFHLSYLELMLSKIGNAGTTKNLFVI